ncbi:Ff.00g103110.m01.CDS01 [Fusarium sp. VM40]|nr:Ff.00g103110.m01.CDS01 [Fusarium sp. VM40]
MATSRSSTQAKPANNQKPPGPRSLMLALNIHDTTSVQERLMRRAAASVRPAEAVDQSSKNKLSEANHDDNNVQDLDDFMKAASCLQSMP